MIPSLLLKIVIWVSAFTLVLDRRNSIDFADVPLACAEGHQVDAHKVILGAVSPFLQNLLRRRNHSSALIYMKGFYFLWCLLVLLPLAILFLLKICLQSQHLIT